MGGQSERPCERLCERPCKRPWESEVGGRGGRRWEAMRGQCGRWEAVWEASVRPKWEAVRGRSGRPCEDGRPCEAEVGGV